MEFVMHALLGRYSVFCQAGCLWTFVLIGIVAGAFMYGVAICKFVDVCSILIAKLFMYMGAAL
jgi:hypothetical protein